MEKSVKPLRMLTPLGFLKLEPVTPEHVEVMARTLSLGTRLSLDFALLVLAACVIATFGLLSNSPAVIIGAMIISPLMLSIQSIAFGLVRADFRLTIRAIVVLMVGAGLAISLSWLMAGLGDLNLLTGLDPSSSEILNRTRPWLPDLAVAVAGGAAGAYALVRPGVGGAIAGVAISTALMPPLCVVGIGLAQGTPAISRGALFLFLANVCGIVVASALVFVLSRIGNAQRMSSGRSLVVLILALLPICLPLAFFMQQIARDIADERLARTVVSQSLVQFEDAQLVRVRTDRNRDQIDVTLTVRSSKGFTPSDVRVIQTALTEHLPGTATLHVLWVPIVRVEAGRTP